ncbi:hypothetical protein Tco_1225010 [Tanacetum coccineum]
MVRYITGKLLPIVFDDKLTSQAALSCEPTVSPLNDNEIDFKISFDESDDEDYTVIFDKKSFSYKIISVDNLKTDSENDNDKVNMPLFSSPEPTVSYFDDLDYLKDFENEFPAIVYNDALTSKLDFLTESTMCPQHVDEFNLKDETSLSKYDKEEQNVLYFNDLFPLNINTDVGAYAQGLNKILKTNMDLPPRDQRHHYLRFEGLGYTDADIKDFEERLEHSDAQGQSVFTSRAWRRLFEIQGPLLGGVRYCMSRREFILGMGLHTAEEIELVGFDAYWAERDFLGTTPSYTLIRDLMLRLCHRYLRMFALGRKRRAMISRGQFIYEELDDTWDWVAPGPERQQVATVGAPEVVEDALVVDEGALDVPTPVQVPQPSPAAGPARTMAQRIARLEEDVRGMDHLITLAKDMGFGQEMHQSEEPKVLYGVTSPKDYAITYSNKETSHHNLYGVECLQDYAATFKYTRDDVSDSILQRNICDRVTP